MKQKELELGSKLKLTGGYSAIDPEGKYSYERGESRRMILSAHAITIEIEEKEK